MAQKSSRDTIFNSLFNSKSKNLKICNKISYAKRIELLTFMQFLNNYNDVIDVYC